MFAMRARLTWYGGGGGGGVTKMVRRPKIESRYNSKFTVKTVKHPDSVMV